MTTMSVMMMRMFFNPFDRFLASEKMKKNSVNKTIILDINAGETEEQEEDTDLTRTSNQVFE